MLVAQIKNSKEVLVILKGQVKRICSRKLNERRTMISDLNHHFVQKDMTIGHALNSYHFKTALAWTRENYDKIKPDEDMSSPDLLLGSIAFLVDGFRKRCIRHWFDKVSLPNLPMP
jgi:hypothetical protein